MLWLKRAQNDLDFYKRKERPEVNRQRVRGTWGRRENPPPLPGGPKGADDGNPLRNNRADVHGSPTVNGDHFKRSRPQCVYLANVKFTCGKRGARIDTPRPPHGQRLSRRFPVVSARQRSDRFVPEDSQPRGVARVQPRCMLLTFVSPNLSFKRVVIRLPSVLARRWKLEGPADWSSSRYPGIYVNFTDAQIRYTWHPIAMTHFYCFINIKTIFYFFLINACVSRCIYSISYWKWGANKKISE